MQLALHTVHTRSHTRTHTYTYTHTCTPYCSPLPCLSSLRLLTLSLSLCIPPLQFPVESFLFNVSPFVVSFSSPEGTFFCLLCFYVLFCWFTVSFFKFILTPFTLLLDSLFETFSSVCFSFFCFVQCYSLLLRL